VAHGQAIISNKAKSPIIHHLLTINIENLTAAKLYNQRSTKVELANTRETFNEFQTQV
jgi:hypothetical protein